MKDEPKPGSKRAIKQGCICPVFYDDMGLFWINKKCPIHGIARNEKEEE